MSNKNKLQAEKLVDAINATLDKGRRFESETERLRIDVARAQVHATLALAEEQRLANLLTWFNSPAENFDEVSSRKIREGLDLA